MSEHDPTSGVRQLWPVVIVERTVPNHTGPNRHLILLVEALAAANPNLSTEYRGGDFLTSDDPGIVWLAQCINVTVRDYFAVVGIDYDVRWSLQAWPNVNRFGDYHDYHNHPRAYLSGTYYLQVPTDRASEANRADVRPGCITLYDPRSMVNMNAIRNDPYVEAEHTITPRPGTILLWPGFLNHFVHPNLSRTPRISISYNVMLKWSDDYLPQQR